MKMNKECKFVPVKTRKKEKIYQGLCKICKNYYKKTCPFEEQGGLDEKNCCIHLYRRNNYSVC